LSGRPKTHGPNDCCALHNAKFIGMVEKSGEEIFRERCLTCGSIWEYDILVLLEDDEEQEDCK
jgi:hypothetical protein